MSKPDGTPQPQTYYYLESVRGGKKRVIGVGVFDVDRVHVPISDFIPRMEGYFDLHESKETDKVRLFTFHEKPQETDQPLNQPRQVTSIDFAKLKFSELIPRKPKKPKLTTVVRVQADDEEKVEVEEENAENDDSISGDEPEFTEAGQDEVVPSSRNPRKKKAKAAPTADYPADARDSDIEADEGGSDSMDMEQAIYDKSSSSEEEKEEDLVPKEGYKVMTHSRYIAKAPREFQVYLDENHITLFFETDRERGVFVLTAMEFIKKTDTEIKAAKKKAKAEKEEEKAKAPPKKRVPKKPKAEA